MYADSRANPAGRLPDDTWVLRPQDLADCFTAGEDTWYFPRVAGTFKERAGFHGCQMPEQLLGRIIRFCSNPGDLVVDPFSGSATTLAVAKKLGRNYLGFDLSEEYVQRGRGAWLDRRRRSTRWLTPSQRERPEHPSEPRVRRPRSCLQNGLATSAPTQTDRTPSQCRSQRRSETLLMTGHRRRGKFTSRCSGRRACGRWRCRRCRR